MVSRGTREEADVRERALLEDPVAGLQMSPDIQVKDGELQLEGNSSHQDKQGRQRGQLQPAQSSKRS